MSATERTLVDVIVAHASPLIRKLVIRALAGCGFLRQVSEAASTAECAVLCDGSERTVVLFDPALAYDAATEVAAMSGPQLAVLLLAPRGWADDPRVQAALRAGARGVVVAPQSFLEADEAAPLIQRRVATALPARATEGAR